jgi:tRNA(fMet)-specific endonuclease VapC
MKIAVDTSALIDFLRRKDKEESIFWLIKDRQDVVVLSSISVAELYAGKSSFQADILATIEEIVAGSEVVIADLSATRSIGKLRRDYGLAIADAYVAQMALDQNLPLATLNTKDFSTIPELKLFEL